MEAAVGMQAQSAPAEASVERPAAADDPARLAARVEAALISAERAVPAGRLAEALGLEHSQPVNEAVAALNEAYQREGRAFRVEAVAGGFRVMTLPEHAAFLASLHRSRSSGRLSPAALETLAVVAYRQPVLRAELEAVRGAACGEVLRSLMERHLVRIAGRAEEVGRPILYGTTPRFLEVFGLASLAELPPADGAPKPGSGG
ncbi:SMC-Scp complex subunit ScpB [Phycisphaera mikurensis]|uniref:Segregation and condensation protein B n=1 Tax=Phycisphaera mikurensis (strain NBRC 102666 / KCTC 22515 / FYK2301M01) TaxID=1142394 RepID=I0IJ28_PHYMF|nr:SMC-Scp complex subunit ScpB [Phycisphaera mikurensis]MBB6443113.1 segregation and condensation protein B [Phycisphaera mikurensis]BAM05266.1 segregation and condensation protein B [Phycisphaera mikurensis NBRC 102666]